MLGVIHARYVSQKMQFNLGIVLAVHLNCRRMDSKKQPVEEKENILNP